MKEEKPYLFFWKMKNQNLQQIPIIGMTEGYTLVYAKDSADAFGIMDKQFNPTTTQFDIKLATILPNQK